MSEKSDEPFDPVSLASYLANGSPFATGMEAATRSRTITLCRRIASSYLNASSLKPPQPFLKCCSCTDRFSFAYMGALCFAPLCAEICESIPAFDFSSPQWTEAETEKLTT